MADPSAAGRAREAVPILLVEDDGETRGLVARSLSEAGFEVVGAERASTASAAVRSRAFAAIVLDVRLPDADGIALCADWRRSGIDVPILILTARTDVSSRVEGLNAGADDYLGKPFAVAELRARLNALVRRGRSGARERIYRIGDLSMDFARRRVHRGAAEIPLTRRELELLERLVRARGHPVSRADLMEELWGESTREAGASLEVIIGRLRRKLDAAGSERLIRTLRGVGYAFSPGADGL
jgi:two-component system OmpR family response regulator